MCDLLHMTFLSFEKMLLIKNFSRRFLKNICIKKIEEESIRAKIFKRLEEFINPSEKAILGGGSSQISDWLIVSGLILT